MDERRNRFNSGRTSIEQRRATRLHHGILPRLRVQPAHDRGHDVRLLFRRQQTASAAHHCAAPPAPAAAPQNPAHARQPFPAPSSQGNRTPAISRRNCYGNATWATRRTDHRDRAWLYVIEEPHPRNSLHLPHEPFTWMLYANDLNHPKRTVCLSKRACSCCG